MDTKKFNWALFAKLIAQDYLYLPRFVVETPKPFTTHDVIKPLYHVSRLISLWPYKYSKRNQITTLTKTDRVLALSFLLLVVAYFLRYLAKKTNTSSQDVNFVPVVVEIIYTLLLHILVIFSVLLVNSGVGKLTKNFYEEIEVIRKLQVFSTDVMYLHLRRKILIQLTATLSFTLSLIFLAVFLNSKYLDISVSVCYVSIYIAQFLMTVIYFQIYYKVEILFQYFQCLNWRFEKSSFLHPENIATLRWVLRCFKCDEIKVFRLIHGKLCNLIHINNDSHGWQIVIFIFTISALVLNSAYPCLTATVYEKYGIPQDAAQAIIFVRETAYITFYLVLVVMLAAKCSATRKQALRTGLIAHKILLDLPLRDEDKATDMYKQQLQLLIDQISYRNPHFSAGGIFSVDYTTVSATANLITSNIIVLLQVRQSPTCNFIVNGTVITQAQHE